MSSLAITSGPSAGQTVELDGEVVIGREGVSLVIDDPQISRRHVSVKPVDDGVVVEDLGSTNGTFVNGERATGPVTLHETGTVHVGTTDFEVRIPVAAPTRVGQLAGFDPDVTRPRAIADPNATVQRPVADPDLTAQRPVAVPAAAPPPAESEPASEPEPAPPPRPAAGGLPPAALAAIGVVAAIVIVVVLVVVVL